MLLYELIVRHILIESSNDIIAISPGIEFVIVILMAISLGVTDQIKPVPGPSLAILRRSE
jgi:hypothetical protein